jgi:serine/threonine-protein kinase
MIPLKLVREALRQSYEVKRSIGRGCMAEVYLAVRLEDGEEVAVKLFNPSYQMTKWSARFHREIELLQQLHHPSIQPLITSGEVAHLVYYVMPVADGGSLDGRMRRNRRHSLAETLEVIQPVAAALDYAHDQNVVHRDIKPGNILFHEGRTRLCDFGIARAIRLAGGEYLTSIGVRIGTPTYMSPEQSLGEREIDGRSDIYSLACVVYEMLVGEPLFSGSDQTVMAKHAKQPPPSARVVRPDLPQYVEDAIHAALAKQPGDRPASVGEFEAGLGG